MDNKHKDSGIGITMVAACSRSSNVIGKDGDIPWNMPSDLSFFKNYTLGKIVIMGRKTFESLPSFLDDRTLVILSRNVGAVKKHIAELKNSGPNVVVPVIWVVSSIKVFLLDYAEIKKRSDIEHDEVIVAGGESIYKKFLPYEDKIILTIVNCDVDGDRYFPNFNKEFWTEEDSDINCSGPSDEYTCSRYFYINEHNVSNVYDIKTGNVIPKIVLDNL